jgi:hypothetical protein
MARFGRATSAHMRPESWVGQPYCPCVRIALNDPSRMQTDLATAACLLKAFRSPRRLSFGVTKITGVLANWRDKGAVTGHIEGPTGLSAKGTPPCASSSPQPSTAAPITIAGGTAAYAVLVQSHLASQTTSVHQLSVHVSHDGRALRHAHAPLFML